MKRSTALGATTALAALLALAIAAPAGAAGCPNADAVHVPGAELQK